MTKLYPQLAPSYKFFFVLAFYFFSSSAKLNAQTIISTDPTYTAFTAEIALNGTMYYAGTTGGPLSYQIFAIDDAGTSAIQISAFTQHVTALSNFVQLNGNIYFASQYGLNVISGNSVSQVNTITGLTNGGYTVFAGPDKIFMRCPGVGTYVYNPADGTTLKLTSYLTPGNVTVNLGLASDQFVAYNNKEYFIGQVQSSSNYVVLQTDGTNAGTRYIQNVSLQAGFGNAAGQFIPPIYNGKIIFDVLSGFSGGYSIYAINPAAPAGTVVNPFNASNQNLTICNGKLFNGNTRYYDGSVNGFSTSATIALSPVGQGLASASNRPFSVYNNKMYGSYYDSNGNELWASDGTDAGTALVKDIYPGTYTDPTYGVTPYSSNPIFSNYNNGFLYFEAADSTATINGSAVNIFSLWQSDGTAAGTVKLFSNCNYYYISGNYAYCQPAYGANAGKIIRVTLIKAAQTIAFNLTRKTTRDVDFDPAATSSSGLPVTYTSDNPAVATIVNNKIHIVGKGTSNITATQAGNSNFAPASVVQVLTVVQLPDQVITFPAIAAKTYGNPDFDPGATSSNNTIPITYSSSDTSLAKIINGKIHLNGAGTVTITANQAADSSFNAAAPVSQSLKINKDSQTITVSATLVVTYGAADFSPATVNSNLPLTYTSSNSVVATVVNGNIHIHGIGSSTITAYQPGNANYNVAMAAKQTLTVLPDTIIIIADNLIKPQGTANPKLTFTYSSFAYGETNAKLTTVPTISTTAATASPLGSYPITVAGAVAANYVFTYVAGTLTVAPPAPAITYTGGHTFTVGTTITPITPVNTGGAVPANSYGQAVVTNSFAIGGIANIGNNNILAYGTAVDASGNIYVADRDNNVIRKITAAGVSSIFAGSGTSGAANGAGVAASFSGPTGITIDAAGNLYVADTYNNVIRKITAAGVVTTFAASSAAPGGVTFNYPFGVAADQAGDVFIISHNETGPSTQVIKADPSGNLSTIISNFNYISAVAADRLGNLFYIVNNTIYKSNNGVFAGSSSGGNADGTGSAASFNNPTGLTFDGAGNVFVADAGNNSIRMISPQGVVTTIAGNGTQGAKNGFGALSNFYAPCSIACDNFGKLYVGDAGNNLVRKISLDGYFINPQLPSGLSFDNTTGIISGMPFKASAITSYVIAANNSAGSSKTGGYAITVSNPAAPKISYAGPKTYTTGTAISTLSPVNAGGAVNTALYGQTTTFAGTGFAGSTNGRIDTASFQGPGALAYDKSGNLYVADGTIRMITPAGVVSTYSTANFSHLSAIAVDPSGNVFVVDDPNNIILKINTAGTVSNFAGNSNYGNADGTGASATFGGITGLACDASGNLFVADMANNLIRKVTPAGVVSTFAGNGVFNSVDGTGTSASFVSPTGIAIDQSGNLYVNEGGGNTGTIALGNHLRKITPAGMVTTLAGNGQNGSADGPGASASFAQLGGVATDLAGNIYVSDYSKVRKISPSGIVSTLAGSNTPGYFNGKGALAMFNHLLGIVCNAAGDVLVADQGVFAIRQISATGYSINPALPAGLNFDTTTGNITGTPVQATPATVYRITAFNAGGNSAANLTLTIKSTIPPPNISYTGQFTFNAGFAITPLTPANSGGALTGAAYSISPGLPANLSFDQATGIISGTPAAATPPTVYTITATNSGGSSSVTETITILNLAPNISYTAQAFPINNLISPLSPVNNGGAVSVSVPGQTTTFAGSITVGDNNGTGLNASFDSPTAVATDAAGNVYVTDVGYALIRKITPGGVVTTIAGNGSHASVNGVGQAASFTFPVGIAVDPGGNIYVADQGNDANVIRKIAPDGTVSTFAGGGGGYPDGTGTAASFSQPSAIVIDKAGNLYVADSFVIRKITPDAVVTTFAGSLSQGQGFADGQGAAASFYRIDGLAIDAAGNIYVTDNESLIREVSPSGYVSTIFGKGNSASYNVSFGSGLALDNSGNIYVTEGIDIRMITPGGVVTTLAGGTGGSYADGVGAAATFNGAWGMAIDAAGYLYVADQGNNLIRRIATNPAPVNYLLSPALPAGLSFDNNTGIISGTPTVLSSPANYYVTAYNNGGADAATVNLSVFLPLPVISYASPQTYAVNTTIMPLVPGNSGGAVDSTKTVTTIAGTIAPGNDNGPVASATFSAPNAVATDLQGNIYIADSQNNVIRKISVSGVVSTFAGNGKPALVNATGTAASFNAPSGLVVDPLGNIYVSDQGAVIRKITSSGVVTTFAGAGGQGAANGAATVAKFNRPVGLALDKAGNLYVADSFNNLIRKITPAGVVSTFAGSVGGGLTDGTGTAASFQMPTGLAFDNAGYLYVADSNFGLIRKISPTQVVTTFAGGNNQLNSIGTSVDGTGTNAGLGHAWGLAFDGSGNLYVTDHGFHSIKKVTPLAVVTTIAGGMGQAPGFVNGPGITAHFYQPAGIATDTLGNIYIADSGNNMIREIGPSGFAISGALPAGLNFNTSTGIFTGTPTVASVATNYRIVGYNGSGSDTTTVNIATSITQSLTFNPLNPVIYGSADFAPGATSTNNTIPIAYSSSNPGVATIVSGKIHITGAGTTVITASQAAGPLYSAASSVSQSLTVTQQQQTVSLSAIPTKTYGTADFTPTASASSKLAVTLTSSNPAVATIVNGAVHITGAGTATITASQPGDANYNAATAASQTLTVNKATLTIKADNQTTTFGGVIPTLTATYTGFVNGDTQASLTTLPAITTTGTSASAVGNFPITASGAVAGNYNITYTAGILSITKAPQAITFAALPAASYGGGPISPGATSNSGLAVSYASTDTTIAKVTGTTLTIRGVGQATITASQAGNADYSAATPVNQTLTVGLGSQTITFAALPSKVYGSADFTLAATSSSKLAVSFTSSDATIATINGSTVHIVSAGTVTITANQAGNTQYNAAPNVGQQLVITPAAQTITFTTLTAKTYGTADYTPVASVASKLPVSFASSNAAVATIVNGNIHVTGAGATTITASQAGNGDYNAATAVSQTLTVNKAPLIIKPNAQTITYLSAIPALTVSYTGFVNGDTQASLTALPTVTTTAQDTSAVGNYPMTASGAASNNYTITYQSANLTIGKASQTITFAALPVTPYGSAPLALTATASSGLAVSYASSDTTIAKVTGTSLTIRGVGQATITANQVGGIDYNAAPSVNQVLTVGKGNQVITFAALPSKVYGSADFNLAATSSSKLAVSFTSSDATIATISGSTVHIVSAGTVTITASQAGNTQYNAAPNVGQQLVITPAAQTITFTTLTAKAYGTADYTPVASVASKLPVSFASSNTAVATILNGNIHITAAGTTVITATQAGNTDYSAATAVSQTLTVNPAALIIKPDNQTITYGAAIPVLTVSYTGFVNGDTKASLSTLPSVTTTATAGAQAGNYTITATGAAAANYTITYQGGTFVIGKAAQTITFATLPVTPYGGAPFALTASASSGLAVTYASSDTTIAKVTGTNLTVRGVGQATITASQVGSINYTAAPPVSRVLNVSKGSQAITFASLPSKVYGSVDFNLAATSSSKLAVSYSSSDATVATVSGSTVHIVAAGTVTITASQAGSTQYNAAPNVSQQLVITQIAQTITFAAPVAKTYGAADYAPVASVASKLPITFTSSNPSVATIVNGNIHVTGAGTTTITASQPGNTDYAAATPVGQTLTINPAALTIKADNQTSAYGAAIVALTATYTGFVNSDTHADLTAQASISTTATAASQAGTYAITASGAASNNYTITYTAGSYVITKAPLTITADNKTKTQGSANPTLTASYSGFVNGDGPASFTTAPKITTTALTGSAAGSYPITVGGAVSANYTLTYVAGTLTVNPKTGNNVPTVAIANVTDDSKGFGNIPQPVVKPAMSPNGDGINDVLWIDGIENYPDNKLVLISRDGQKIFETAKYDNRNRVFNGHSSVTGKMQLPGTYFYLLEYVDRGETKRKTGYFVIKNN